MTVEITVPLPHAPEELAKIINDATNYQPEIKSLGTHIISKLPVYEATFDCKHLDDDKIINCLKKLNITIGEVIPTPSSYQEFFSQFRQIV